MMNMRNGKYSPEVFNHYNLDQSLIPPLTVHGEILGTLKPEIAKFLKIK